MKKRRFVKLITTVTIIVIAVLVLFGSLFVEKNSSDSDYNNADYSAIHTVRAYDLRNSIYQDIFDDIDLTAYDGADGEPDLCLPALCKNDGFVPQGLAYYAEKDWFLISSYSSEKENVASLIFALDAKTGDLKATYALYDTDNTPFTGHVGGIGVSQNDLYITTDSAEISYIPLSELTLQNSVKNLTFAATADFNAYLGEAGTSYLSVTDNTLSVGNFYHTKDGYDKKASEKANSVVLAFTLSGDNSLSEWENLINSAPITYYLPDSVSKIQSAVILGDKMHLASSYGRRNNSIYYVIDISNEVEIKDENIQKYECLPMMEGMAVKNNELYFITESAAYKYYGKEFFNRAKHPTDVIWKIG